MNTTRQLWKKSKLLPIVSDPSELQIRRVFPCICQDPVSITRHQGGYPNRFLSLSLLLFLSFSLAIRLRPPARIPRYSPEFAFLLLFPNELTANRYSQPPEHSVAVILFSPTSSPLATLPVYNKFHIYSTLNFYLKILTHTFPLFIF